MWEKWSIWRRETEDSDALAVELEDLLEGMGNENEFESDVIFTSANESFASELQNYATIHAVSIKMPNTWIRRYERGEFHGDAIDTCWMKNVIQR